MVVVVVPLGCFDSLAADMRLSPHAVGLADMRQSHALSIRSAQSAEIRFLGGELRSSSPVFLSVEYLLARRTVTHNRPSHAGVSFNCNG
jgi:hypothetical protein